jgi:phage-related protein
MRISERLEEFLDRQAAVTAFLRNLPAAQKEETVIIDDLESAFMWASSKEGNDYWSNLSEQYQLELLQDQQIAFVNSIEAQ